MNRHQFLIEDPSIRQLGLTRLVNHSNMLYIVDHVSILTIEGGLAVALGTQDHEGGRGEREGIAAFAMRSFACAALILIGALDVPELTG